MDDLTPNALCDEYLRLTRDALPAAARRAAEAGEAWPIALDHCFMRVVLDNTFSARWDSVIHLRPAYRHLDPDQLCRAVAIARSMLDGGRERVRTLDAASLRCRVRRSKA